MQSDLVNFCAMLDRAGYQYLEDSDLDPKDIGHFEYIRVNKGTTIIVAMGPGRIGDSDTSVNMRFKPTGEFESHNCLYEEDDD